MRGAPKIFPFPPGEEKRRTKKKKGEKRGAQKIPITPS